MKFESSVLRFQEYYHQLKELGQRILRLEKEIGSQADEGVHAPTIQALQALRGVALITATSLVAEIGSFNRFTTPKQFMAYVGLIPSEFSSGKAITAVARELAGFIWEITKELEETRSRT